MRINTLKPNRWPGGWALQWREASETKREKLGKKKGLRSLVTFTNWMCDQSVKPEWKKWGGSRQTRCGPQMLFIRISFSSHFSLFLSCVRFLLFFVPICDWFERLVLEESVARGKRDPDGAERAWSREKTGPFHVSLNWHLCSPQRRRHWNSHRCQPDSQTWLCVTLVWKTAAMVSYGRSTSGFKHNKQSRRCIPGFNIAAGWRANISFSMK